MGELTHRLPLAAAAALVALGLAVAAGAADSGPAPVPPEKAAEFRPNPPGLDASVPHGRKPPAVAAPEPPWRAGIVESGLAPLPSSRYTIENQWQSVVAGHHVNVYAGVASDEPETGVVILQTTSLDGRDSAPPAVYAVPGAGPLRVTSAAADVLRLRGAHASLSFDVGARRLAGVGG
jgi:hypothetical protein